MTSIDNQKTKKPEKTTLIKSSSPPPSRSTNPTSSNNSTKINFKVVTLHQYVAKSKEELSFEPGE